MVLPNWKVKTERFVTLAPVVANAFVGFDNESRNTQCFETSCHDESTVRDNVMSGAWSSTFSYHKRNSLVTTSNNDYLGILVLKSCIGGSHF